MNAKKCDEIDGAKTQAKARLGSTKERGQTFGRLHQNNSICGGGLAFARGGVLSDNYISPASDNYIALPLPHFC